MNVVCFKCPTLTRTTKSLQCSHVAFNVLMTLTSDFMWCRAIESISAPMVVLFARKVKELSSMIPQ